MNKRTLKATLSVVFLSSVLAVNAGEPTVTTGVVETVKTKAGDVANFVTEKAGQVKTAGSDYVVTPVTNSVKAAGNSIATAADKVKTTGNDYVVTPVSNGAKATGEYVSTKADQATFGVAAFVGNVKETVATKYKSAKNTAGKYKHVAAKKAKAVRGYVSAKAQAAKATTAKYARLAKTNATIGFDKASSLVKNNPKKSAAIVVATAALGYVVYKYNTMPVDEDAEEASDNAHNTFFALLPFIG